jgi:hypothetical protein
VTKTRQPVQKFAASGWGIGEFFGFILLVWQQDSNVEFEFGDINADRDKIHHGTP